MIASDTLFQLDFFLGRIDSDYIKYLYEADRFHHVYYKDGDLLYNSKRPYLFTYQSFTDYLYAMPITSFEEGRFDTSLKNNYVKGYILLEDYFGVKKDSYLGAVRPCYMIPVKEGVYHRISLDEKVWLANEYNVIKNEKLPIILDMAQKYYYNQNVKGILNRQQVCFADVEDACDKFSV